MQELEDYVRVFDMNGGHFHNLKKLEAGMYSNPYLADVEFVELDDPAFLINPKWSNPNSNVTGKIRTGCFLEVGPVLIRDATIETISDYFPVTCVREILRYVV